MFSSVIQSHQSKANPEKAKVPKTQNYCFL